MNKQIISLIAVIIILSITATCSGPSVVHTEKLKRNDTIFVVTQPGYAYRISVIPELFKVKDESAFNPQIFTNSINITGLKSLFEKGIAYDFFPCMDTMHIITIQGSEGLAKKTCYEINGEFTFDCDGVEVSVPCTEDVTINCDDY